jgi:ribonuclease HII
MKQNNLFKFDNYVNNKLNSCYLIGIDEVGRGALAGPVIACAFSWDYHIKSKKSLPTLFKKLNDSKQLTRQIREELYVDLIKHGVYAVGYASVLEIEGMNILNATFLAMKRAFEKFQIKNVSSDIEPYLLIDGNKFNPYINCRQLSIIDGDAKSSVIAAASVIAKVYRDRLMGKISSLDKFKKYGWNRNAGYGTAFHQKAIRKHGLTPLHRKLFVRNIFNQTKKLSCALN